MGTAPIKVLHYYNYDYYDYTRLKADVLLQPANQVNNGPSSCHRRSHGSACTDSLRSVHVPLINHVGDVIHPSAGDRLLSTFNTSILTGGPFAQKPALRRWGGGGGGRGGGAIRAIIMYYYLLCWLIAQSTAQGHLRAYSLVNPLRAYSLVNRSWSPQGL